MIARGLLGIHQGRVIGMSAMFLVALAFAWITVRDTTRGCCSTMRSVGRAGGEGPRGAVGSSHCRTSGPHASALSFQRAEHHRRAGEERSRGGRSHGGGPVGDPAGGADAWRPPLRPFAEELALVRAYAGVEQRRLGPRLEMRWEISGDVLEAAVPTLSLQPLVENAIKHGTASRIDGGAVTVEAVRAANTIQITVTDEGDGFAAGWTEGTGLGNLRERLRSLYGGRAALEILPGPGGRVRMTVPWPRNDRGRRAVGEGPAAAPAGGSRGRMRR